MTTEDSKLFQAGNRAQLEQFNENKWFNISMASASHEIIDNGYDIRNKIQSCRKRKYQLETIRRYAAEIANHAHKIIMECDEELNNGS